MILLLLAYLGGVLTILSPCILPVLPFVFARAGQPFLRSSLPLLLGMALTFAAVATLAAVGGAWAVQANQYGRIAALLLLAFFGFTLLFPVLADRLTRPLVAAGARLSQSAQADADGGARWLPSLVLGVATGLLWAPCAGPILGLVLTGAALNGANAGTSLLLLAYAAGAATSLALALLLGGRVLATLKRSLGAGEWIRRGLGAAVLAAVAVIALGLDVGLLTRLSVASTTRIEQALLERIHPEAATPSSVVMEGDPAMMMSANPAMMMAASADPGAAEGLAIEGLMPSLDGASAWLNSPALTAAELRGKVVLIDFWTYSCVNCLRTLPYVRAWAEKYRDQGLVVIGVHAPEFAFEKDLGNVHRAVRELKLEYPIAVDNDYAIWRAFRNRYWPAHYFVDAQGRIRHHQFGEGHYQESEAAIQKLLAEAGATVSDRGYVEATTDGAALAADAANVRSQETYLGYSRAERFASPGGQLSDQSRVYTAAAPLRSNQWALMGQWRVEDEKAGLEQAAGKVLYRFHARDLNLVLGPGADGKPVQFRIRIDGQAPGSDHGLDAAADGSGVVSEQRMYQLIRQRGAIVERTFEIEFLDPGVQAYAFTFG